VASVEEGAKTTDDSKQSGVSRPSGLVEGAGYRSWHFSRYPDVKVKQFAAEARSLDVASMNDLTEAKRLTLAATLVFAQTGRALDDVADMFVRLVQRLHNQARAALLEYQAKHVERTDSLVATLHGVTLAYRTEGSAEQRLSAIGEFIEPDSDRILDSAKHTGRRLEEITFPSSHASIRINEQPFSAFWRAWNYSQTSSDKSMTDAIAFLVAHRKSRQDRLPVLQNGPGERDTSFLDLSFVEEPWWPCWHRTRSRRKSQRMSPGVGSRSVRSQR